MMAGLQQYAIVTCLLSGFSLLYMFIKHPDMTLLTAYPGRGTRSRLQKPGCSPTPQSTAESTTGWPCNGPVTVMDSKNTSAVLNVCNHGLPVFLNPYDLSSATFNRFGNVSYNLPFGIAGVEQKVMSILNFTKDYSLPAQIHRVSNRSCVVVGNSFILKGRGIGSIIDSYDTVIRINDAPTKGYETDVGSKCTMRVVYPMTATKDQLARDQNDTIALFVPFKAADIDWLLRVVQGTVAMLKTRRFTWDVPPHNVRVLNPVFMRTASFDLLRYRMPTRKRRAPIPTTGFVTVTAALHMCGEVHIAGFGYPKVRSKSGKELVHYYGEGYMQQITRAKNHDVTPEGAVLQNMIASGLIKNLTPN